MATEKSPQAGSGSHVGALATLASLGLAERSQKNVWIPRASDIHLDQGQAFSATQHAHWRMQAATRVFHNDPRALHYTGVHT